MLVKVVTPGRIFLRRLIDLSVTMTTLSETTNLTSEAMLDLQWWDQFLTKWNGKSMIVSKIKFQVHIFTDASKLGMGGVFNNKWFSVPWPEDIQDMHINILELIAVATSVCTWFAHNKNINVLIYTDNKVIVDIWYTGSTPNKMIMKIIRYLFLFLANNNINIHLQHIYGYKNTAADFLSRLQVDKFMTHQPGADREMTQITPDILYICKH